MIISPSLHPTTASTVANQGHPNTTGCPGLEVFEEITINQRDIAKRQS